MNAALAGGFGWAAFRLASEAGAHVDMSGGLPDFTYEGMKSLALSPQAASIMGNLGVAWACAVTAAGCAFMALLGARWCFHAGLRALSSLRA